MWGGGHPGHTAPPPAFSASFPGADPWVGPKPIRSGSQSLMGPLLLKSFRRSELITTFLQDKKVVSPVKLYLSKWS